MKVVRVSGLLVISMLVVLQGISASELSDDAAKNVLEELWNDEALLIPLGELTVVDGVLSKPKAGQITQAHMKIFEECEKLGLVKITLTKDLSKEFKGWNDWMKLTAGVRGSIVVEATDRGRSHEESSDEVVPSDFLRLPAGEFVVQGIVSNEEKSAGMDKYRVVLGKHRVDLSFELYRLYSRLGVPAKKEGKFAVLLKYDPFDDSWSIVAQDLANREEEFSTENVNQAMRKIGL